jgi:uncharacterized protein (TIGR02996 family)
MPTRSYADAFLEAILQNPEDDTPRLVYADWLDEQGDPASTARADFIRLQCALALGSLAESRRIELQARQQHLLERFSRQWAGPLVRLVRTWKFHRGFIDEVSVASGKFLSCAGRLFRLAPIRHVQLERELIWPADSRFSVPALADSEYLRRLHSLDLSDNRLETRHLRALLVSEYLDNLTVLNLRYNRIGDGGLRSLCQSPLLARLTHLDLAQNALGPGAVRALARAVEELTASPNGLRLRRIDLRGNLILAAGYRVIAESPVLQRLVRV